VNQGGQLSAYCGGVKSGRWLLVLGLGELVIVGTYVVDRFTDVDLSSGTKTVLKVLLVVGAVMIAGSAYRTWSAAPSSVNLLATLLGLMAGATLASTVVTANDVQIYRSGVLATLGTIGLVAAVAFAQVGMVRGRESQP
jgi:peptidoglycan/LPS O-acetylase OafA/YrhL